MASGSKKGKVHFLNTAMLPCSVAFCMDAGAWERELRRIQLPVEMRESLSSTGDGATHVIGGDDGSRMVYVCIKNKKGVTPAMMIGLMAYEATHAFDAIVESMNGAEPSPEFKAYTIQWLTQQFYTIWMDSKKVKK